MATLGRASLRFFQTGPFARQKTHFSLPSSVKLRCRRYQNPILIPRFSNVVQHSYNNIDFDLSGSIVFCDNIGHQAALTMSYSLGNDICTPIAHLFWMEPTRRGLELWIARVSSNDNLADGPSRFREVGALSAVQHLKLTFTHPSFHKVELVEMTSAMDSRR